MIQLTKSSHVEHFSFLFLFKFVQYVQPIGAIIMNIDEIKWKNAMFDVNK